MCYARCFHVFLLFISLNSWAAEFSFQYDASAQFVQFSDDSRIIVSRSGNGEIRINRLSDGLQLNHFYGSRLDPSLSSKGNLLTYAIGLDKAKVVQLETGEEKIFAIPLETKTLQLSANGSYLLAYHKGSLQMSLIDTYTGLSRVYQYASNITGALISPDETNTITFLESGLIRITTISSGNVVEFTHDNPVTSACLSFDGKKLLSGDSVGVFKITDIASGAKHEFYADGEVFSVGCSKRDSRAFVSINNRTGTEQSFYQVDLLAGTAFQHLTSQYGKSVAFLPDGKTYFLTQSDEFSIVKDIKKDREAVFFWPHVNMSAISPSGKSLAVATYGGHVSVVNIGKIVSRVFPSNKEVSTSDLSTDQSKVAAGFNDGRLIIYDLKQQKYLIDYTFEKRSEISSHSSVFPAKFSPDSNFIFACSENGTANVFDLKSSESNLPSDVVKHTLVQNQSYPSSISGGFSSYGNNVWTAFEESSKRYLSIFSTNGTLFQSKILSKALVKYSPVSFSPDGKKMLVVSYDGVRILDLENSQRPEQFFPFGVIAAVFSLDGSKVIATTDSSQVKVIQLDNERLQTFNVGSVALYAYAPILLPRGEEIAVEGYVRDNHTNTFKIIRLSDGVISYSISYSFAEDAILLNERQILIKNKLQMKLINFKDSSEEIVANQAVGEFCISPDGLSVFYGTNEDKKGHLVNLQNKNHSSVQLMGAVTSCNFSHDGKGLLVSALFPMWLDLGELTTKH